MYIVSRPTAAHPDWIDIIYVYVCTKLTSVKYHPATAHHTMLQAPLMRLAMMVGTRPHHWVGEENRGKGRGFSYEQLVW